MHPDELAFFLPQMLPLYEAFRETLLSLQPDTAFTVHKTQISFTSRHMYGCVSLPRRKAERDAGWLLLTFGLPYQVSHERILQSVEAYPGRWTHHLLLRGTHEIDDQLLHWFREACHFAERK